MLTQALQYLTKAVEIHPLYKNAYLITGNAQYHLGEYEKSVDAYRKALQLDPGYKDASVNMAVALRDAGKIAGEKENNLVKAELYLTESLKITTNDPETYRLMGVLNGVKGNHAEAIKYFLKVAEIDSSNANAFLNLSHAYRNMGDNINADKHLEKAKSLNPNVLNQ